MDDSVASAGLKQCLEDHSVESLEKAIKFLRIPCQRPPGLLRWLESTLRNGAPTDLCYQAAM